MILLAITEYPDPLVVERLTEKLVAPAGADHVSVTRAFPTVATKLVGVAGIGQQAWLSSPLALANLYAFGRLAWDSNLTPEQIADEWTRQTISNDPEVVHTVGKMLLPVSCQEALVCTHR